MAQLQQLDLCSGVGVGFPLSGLQLGFELIGVAEIDSYCSDILSKRYPGIHNYGCVKSLAFDGGYGLRPGTIDLITASPPCQPFSIQGKRQGAADERDCFPAVLKIVARYKPRFVVIENVPGLLTCPYSPGDSRMYCDYIGSHFKESRYFLEGIIVSSGHFAAPFDRKRLLLVAVSDSIKYQKKPSPWSEQIREFFEAEAVNQQRRGCKPGISGECLQSSHWLDRPTGRKVSLGILRGNGTVRDRRSALGNALDPRVASVALRRILYLQSIAV
ncbi:MAG: DNA cytosine methyltransferase [Scytonema hyalinum WJT4-NPBG1]|nr:DNA cytosine methyltransferase [Scytonema hyalinum WJT4-NPBG1]